MKLKQKALKTFESRHFAVFITDDETGKKVWYEDLHKWRSDAECLGVEERGI